MRSRGKVCKEQSGNEESDKQSERPTTRDRARQETAEFLRARQACAVSGSANPTDLVSLGSREGDESGKPKEYFSSRKPGHSKGEYRYFSAVKEKRLVQQDEADRHTGRDVCLFHEDDNDQGAQPPCPSLLIDKGSDDLGDLMALLCQVWFDAEAPESFECDGLDATATTEQHLRTLARSKLQIPQHECWYSESRRRVRREKRDEINRCCWTADRRRSGSATERG